MTAREKVNELAQGLPCPTCGAQPHRRCRYGSGMEYRDRWVHEARSSLLVEAFTIGLAAAALGRAA